MTLEASAALQRCEAGTAHESLTAVSTLTSYGSSVTHRSQLYLLDPRPVATSFCQLS